MNKFILILLTLLLSGDTPVTTQDTPNFIVECYHHCDHSREVCNNHWMLPWHRPIGETARCQVLYRECLSACNQHRIIDMSTPSATPTEE